MQTHYLVTTDLDGTLLDHEDYSFTAATAALKQLRETNIPLILNSSKTAQELAVTSKQLHISYPYICENGSAIFLDNATLEDKGTQRVKKFGLDRSLVLEVINKLKHHHQFAFTGFSNMSVEELIQSTGLSRESALLAKAREFTEPIIWQDTKEQYVKFKYELELNGLTAIKGGRFIHVSSPVTKAIAMQWLKKYYEDMTNSEIKLIALGDSDNDIAMLECADIAVLVKSRSHQFPTIEHHNIIKTEKFGPAGWNDAMLEILNTI